VRNAARVLLFDIAAPLAVIAAVLLVGVFLDWPLWWVVLASMLCLLVGEGMVVNFYLMRRDRVTVGTDDDGAPLRLGLTALAAVGLTVAAVLGYTHQTLPDRTLRSDADEVVRLATAVSEATATFSPQDPRSSIERAVALMVPEQAEAFRKGFAKSTEDLARKNISVHVQTISAGIEALGPQAASVAVVMRGTQSTPGAPPSRAVLALRVGLTKIDHDWRVVDVVPVSGT
jgi:hypothetical protein